MGTLQYKVGKRHGLAKLKFLNHRNGRRYDSLSANESYQHGYSAGVKERNNQAKMNAVYHGDIDGDSL